MTILAVWDRILFEIVLFFLIFPSDGRDELIDILASAEYRPLFSDAQETMK